MKKIYLFEIVVKIVAASFLLANTFLLTTIQVNAYIDPSIVTYSIQAIAGIAVALGAVASIFYRKIKKWFIKYFEIEEINKNYETNDIYFKYQDEERHAKYKPKERTIKEKPIGFISALFVIVAVLLFFLYAPLEMFFANQSDFWFDFSIIIPYLLQAIGVMFVLLCIIYFVAFKINKKLYQWLLNIAVLLLVITYIQGTFLSGNLPTIDGTTIDWNSFQTEKIISIILLLVGVGVIIFGVKKLGLKRLTKASVALSVILSIFFIISTLTIGMQTGGFNKKHVTGITTKNEFTYSKDKNLVVFVADTVDAKDFKKLLEKEPEYEKEFEDFTFYTNTMSAYPYTYWSVPYLVGGQWIESGEKLSDYGKRNVEDSRILDYLEKEDYEIGLYTNSINYSKTDTSRFVNFVEGGVTVWRTAYLESAYRLCWYKYAPYYLKQYSGVKMSMFSNLLVFTGDKENEPFILEPTEFYKSLKEHDIKVSDKKQFKLIHFDGAHPPYNFDENVNYIGEDKGTYELNIKATNTVLKEYLDKLKSSGVYDDTAIVIISDHGFNPEKNQAGKYKTSKRQNPFMLVKGAHEHHDFKYDDRPIEFLDLQEAYKNLLDGKTEEEVFDVPDGVRKRTYYISEGSIFRILETEGHASDSDALEDTGITIRKVE